MILGTHSSVSQNSPLLAQSVIIVDLIRLSIGNFEMGYNMNTMSSMKIYPALKGTMGVDQPPYYIVVMQVKDLVSEVGFSHEMYFGKRLSDALQRERKKVRNKSIMSFLDRPDRFISAIVVAALGGQPQFLPIEVTTKEVLLPFSMLEQAFGALTFQGGESYYALDGQHRLFALKEKALNDPGILEDEIPVILILGDGKDELSENSKQRYRRLFAWMNRYAEKTSPEVNIITDEEDLYSIVTRRLVEEYSFLSNTKFTSNTIKPEKDSQFTTLQTLHEFTAVTLHFSGIELPSDVETKRPDDDLIDRSFLLSTKIWDALRHNLPELNNNPMEMRYDIDPEKDNLKQNINHLLFRPIGQQILCRIVAMLGYKSIDDSTSSNKLNKLLNPIAAVDWEIRNCPWRYLLINPVTMRKAIKYKVLPKGRKAGIMISGMFFDKAFDANMQPIEPWLNNVQVDNKDEEWKNVIKVVKETRQRIKSSKPA